MPPLKTLIRSVCVCVCVSTKQQILHFHGCILLTKTIHLIFWGGEIWLQRTLWPSLPWWIGRVTYADFDLSPWPFVCKGDAFRITIMWHVRKKRSGLWENKPPSFSPPRWWVYCFASQWLLLYCWALEVYVARNLTFVPRREEACDRGCFDYTQKSSGQKEHDFLSLCWRRTVII